ncbi:MAG: sporulation protein [Saprospiraceae bacterium]|nr:sporulation protein [Saprospiraceae bacterium]
MLGRVKKWLGIEGIKVQLIVPEGVIARDGVIQGQLQFYSMHAQTISSLHFKLIEKYIRGRKKRRLTDEYLLAEKEVHQLIEVPEKEVVEIDFDLNFEMVHSQMDELQSKNILLRGLIGAAKKLKSVRSEYRIEVEADVVGTALNPFDRKVITIAG